MATPDRDPPLPGDPDRRSTDEIMAALDLSSSALYRWLDKGLPSYRVLGERVFRWSEVERWVKEQAMAAAEKEG